MFGVQLVHQSDRKQLTTIQQSQSNLQDKCREVLELWARRGASRWEDVIARLRVIGLSRLADELTKELDRSSQPPGSEPSKKITANGSSTPGNHIRSYVARLHVATSGIHICFAIAGMLLIMPAVHSFSNDFIFLRFNRNCSINITIHNQDMKQNREVPMHAF